MFFLQELGLESKRTTFQARQSDNTDYVTLRLEPVNSAVVTVEGGSVRLVKLLAGAQAAQVLVHNGRQLVMNVVKFKAEVSWNGDIEGVVVLRDYGRVFV